MTREKFLQKMREIEEQISLQPYKAGQLVPAENEEEEMEEQLLDYLPSDGVKISTKEQAVGYLPSGGAKLTPAEEQEEVEEKAPPGWEGTVKAMKKHRKITNPWALAWYMKHKGAHPHYKKSGKKKKGKRQKWNKRIS
jgi:hypothetical protein